MNSTLTSDTSPRELCSRSSNGIEVALLWTPDTEQLRVAVIDLRSNQSFDLPVDSSRAMQVFHHPYPYAAEWAPLDGDAETERNLARLAELETEEPAP
ncbi:MAG TPA: hypothetical protein VHS27_18360 [Gaiellales bacterium]|jgi:hypothetical protein|nr:hypothetical protein [Gaiellales bacterium]